MAQHTCLQNKVLKNLTFEKQQTTEKLDGSDDYRKNYICLKLSLLWKAYFPGSV